ncbi:MAG: nif-specific transcriptional activator NifA [Gammaproteobacteria bacterium]|jgi:Nif-specific regulatory protein
MIENMSLEPTEYIDINDRSDLLAAELDTLFRVSQVLSQSLNLSETLQGVLLQIHEKGGLRNGMVSLVQPDKGEMLLSAVHGDPNVDEVRYRSGEGIVGSILEEGRTVVVKRISDEPRFLGRLGLYDKDLPFIGVPIRVSGKLVGVLAAQPNQAADSYLTERAQFMEMLGNLIGQAVRLSWEVEKERSDLMRERDSLKRQVRGSYGFSNMVGHTAVMKRVFELIRQVAKWDTTVLIRGESGTGKELIANAIHYNSPRANAPFVKLNCAALPDNLLETELFGHEKGAFTGAVSMRKGRFEQADGGTIFLDEIGEISPTFQAKLLRVLQEGEFERVGGTKTLKVNVRVIAATNKDLESEVEAGEFREDLYYRLNVMPINIPALRERSEDIPDLAEFLIGKIAKAQNRPLEITDSAIRMLMRYHWPGNVREMENTLERASIMSEDGKVDRGAISLAGLEDKLDVTAAAQPQSKIDLDDPDLDERERVIAALEQTGWVQAKAARLLNMTPRQIAYRIQTLNIKMRHI